MKEAQLEENLKNGLRTIIKNDEESYLLHDPELPFIAICSCQEDEDCGAIAGLVKSVGSFMVYNQEDGDDFKKRLLSIADAMQARYKSFLFLEIDQNSDLNDQVILRAPRRGLDPFIKNFKQGFEKFICTHSDNALTLETKRVKYVLTEAFESLSSQGDNSSFSSVRITIPKTVSRKHPIQFRKFRERFASLLKNAVYEFIKVQTTSSLTSYLALGRRSIHEKVYELDAALTSVESQYDFLLQVAPTNIGEIRNRFYETGFKEVVPYKYRLLTVDPDILKRRLYDLPLEKIDDPALSYIYSEKRTEIDRQLTMLKDRGTSKFYYTSQILHGVVSPELYQEALSILDHHDEFCNDEDEKPIDAREFSARARKEFDYFKSQDNDFEGKVHIRDDVNIIMVSRGELYLPENYRMDEREANALIQHEIGTHALTYYNGRKQPLSQLCQGLANYDTLQEGLAVFAEFLCGNLSVNRLRILAGRVVAGKLLMEGARFRESFLKLHEDYNFTRDRAFNITSRMYQGGGFLKDIIYLRGLLEVVEFIKAGGEIKQLLAGKFALEQLPVIQELTERELLLPPVILPKYIKEAENKDKLSQIQRDPSLYKLAES